VIKLNTTVSIIIGIIIGLILMIIVSLLNDVLLGVIALFLVPLIVGGVATYLSKREKGFNVGFISSIVCITL